MHMRASLDLTLRLTRRGRGPWSDDIMSRPSIATPAKRDRPTHDGMGQADSGRYTELCGPTESPAAASGLMGANDPGTQSVMAPGGVRLDAHIPRRA